ncbi:hypothetical protein TNCT_172781 [Trichonephila clavata]|uniref:Uncharacterized protein n=1 Tax=Trichonephila clavata TaxID=2740835 RepID=A0A8X6LIU1_TRICU|nr:hypothetical protein TNCT_172781 [Trichonephila clavata]
MIGGGGLGMNGTFCDKISGWELSFLRVSKLFLVTTGMGSKVGVVGLADFLGKTKPSEPTLVPLRFCGGLVFKSWVYFRFFRFDNRMVRVKTGRKYSKFTYHKFPFRYRFLLFDPRHLEICVCRAFRKKLQLGISGDEYF